jgi:GMP synthase (glutamine-hydrolysing)
MSKIAIVNNAEPGIDEFGKPIEKIISMSGSSSVFIEYAACLGYDFHNFDGVILTGSPQGNDIIEHHLHYFGWIQKWNKPVLGICAGHHITGYLYGSEILRNKKPESGDFKVDILSSDPLFAGMPASFTVKQMHNDSITLPPDFILLATSKTCKNQIMKHKQKPLYTCQFHPEYYNHELIQNFIRICQ